MNYENQERELNLKAMFISAARHWRGMLIAALVLALLLGGVKVLGGLRSVADEKANAALMEAYEADCLAYADKLAALNTKIQMVEEDISQQREYLENSILMQMDHHNACVATVSLVVYAPGTLEEGTAQQNSTLAYVIADAYRVAMLDGRMINKAAEALNMDARYLQELISLPCEVEDETQKGPLVTVNVRCKDMETGEKVVSMLLEALGTVYQQVAEGVAPHTINVVGNSVTMKVDDELAVRQAEEDDRLLEYNDLLEEYQEMVEELTVPVMPELGIGGTVKSAVKYALVGAVVGVFLVAAWACVAFAVGDKVYSAEELRSRFGILLLGKVSLNKRRTFFVDKWLDRLENRGKTPEEGAYSVIRANVRNYSAGVDTLLIAGGAGSEAAEQVARELAKELPGVTLLPGGSLLECPDAVEALGKCGGVILVERCGVSRYSAVSRELELIESVRKPLLGCVTLEA